MADEMTFGSCIKNYVAVAWRFFVCFCCHLAYFVDFYQFTGQVTYDSRN